MFNPEIVAFLMLGGFFVMLMIGVPVAISLATVGFLFGFIGFGLLALQGIAETIRVYLNRPANRGGQHV